MKTFKFKYLKCCNKIIPSKYEKSAASLEGSRIRDIAGVAGLDFPFLDVCSKSEYFLIEGIHKSQLRLPLITFRE
jgi:hypothetical protein